MAKATVTFFGPNGRPVGIGGDLFLPEYLDWLPITAKAFWFCERGLGEPQATHLLLQSQGEQQLVKIGSPLQHMTLKELTEKDNGLQNKVDDYIQRNGISRKPRNQ